MSVPTRQLSHKLANIADSWVKDPFRPNIQLSTFLQSLSRHPRLTPEAVEAATKLQQNAAKKAVSRSTVKDKRGD